jgi:pimeloyl-ACP methyl ester carboxylesterase
MLAAGSVDTIDTLPSQSEYTMRIVAAVLAGALTVTVAAVPAAAAPPTPVEDAYGVRGPWAVSTTTVDTRFVIRHPVNLGANGTRHPIVTWGNGTWGSPAKYPGVLDQLASWGFVVIASTSSSTGSGAEMLAAAQWMVARDTDATSVFAGKLDTAHVAATGHSQGAGGALRATIHSGGLIDTVVPIAVPSANWVSAGHEYDPADLTVPVLFVSGVDDWLISPMWTLTGYYDRAPAGAARASLVGANHTTIQNDGGRFLGYLTAWLRYQLCGDQVARSAFVGAPNPELTTNPAWLNQAVKNLP